jgi:hypothetical protein
MLLQSSYFPHAILADWDNSIEPNSIKWGLDDWDFDTLTVLNNQISHLLQIL